MIRKNYGWVILLIVFVEMLVYGGYVNSIGVFTVPVTEELAVSRGNYSLAMSVRNAVKFFSILCSGFIFQRFGYRRPAMLGLVISAVALGIMASAKSLGMIAIANFLLGTVYGVCVTAGAVRIIRSWFHKHQGFMLGLVTMSTGLGGSLMSGVLTDIIVERSWRMAYGFAAVLLLVLAVAYLLICDEPAQMGLLPYGEGETSGKDKTSKALPADWEGFSMKELMRKPQFYLMGVCMFLFACCVYISYEVMVPHCIDGGYTATEASGFYSVLMLSLSVVKLLGGWMSDRIGAKKVTVFSAFAAMIGQRILADVSNPVLVYIGMVFFSVGLLVTTITVPVLVVPLFGKKTASNLTGIFLGVVSLGSMVADPVANMFYDRMGSYSPLFRMASVAEILLVGLLLTLFWLCDKEKKKYMKSLEV